jgi:hypothetical protein
MSDRGRRERDRVGDDTMARIDGLADGWGAAKVGVPGSASLQTAAGSNAAEALPSDGASEGMDGTTRKVAPTPPRPPPAPARAKRRSAPPPPPPGKPRAGASPVLPTAAAAETVTRPVQVFSSRDSDATVVSPPVQPRAELSDGRPRSLQSHGNTGTLRIPLGLPRRRGFLGDLAYVYTVAFGVARAHRQVGEINRLIDEATATRNERLIALGRTAVVDSGLTLPTVEEAREQLFQIEERRSMRAGHITACDEELAGVTLEHGQERTARDGELVRLRDEVGRLGDKLAPLEKTLTAARRRAQRLGSQLGVLDEKILGRESSLGNAPGGEPPASSDEAAIATLRAERQTIAAEEPTIASQIDDVEPTIAALRGGLVENQKRIAILEEEARDQEVRVAEIRAAIVARKAVEERAFAELGRAQERALRDLGERLGIDRPDELRKLLVPVERSELRLAELQRRLLELGELVGAVNRRALFRGIAWIGLIALGLAAIAALSFMPLV